MADITPNLRVALRNDSYVLHKILPNKVLLLIVSSVSCVTMGTGRPSSQLDDGGEGARLNL